MIASPLDLSTAAAWSNFPTITITGGTSPISGVSNTSAIVTQGAATEGYAAKLCDAYTNTDSVTNVVYSDWYLPAVWELTQLYNAAFVVNTVLGEVNGFQQDRYWSSTQFDASSAWLKNFNYANAATDGTLLKSVTARVRAVRSF